MATRWPKEAPILDASDFCRGTYHHGTKSCLLGHANNFISPCGPKSAEVHAAIVNAMWDFGWRGFWIDDFVDCRNNSLRLFAKVWNKAMAKLGYTEGNPEKP